MSMPKDHAEKIVAQTTITVASPKTVPTKPIAQQPAPLATATTSSNPATLSKSPGAAIAMKTYANFEEEQLAAIAASIEEGPDRYTANQERSKSDDEAAANRKAGAELARRTANAELEGRTANYIDADRMDRSRQMYQMVQATSPISAALLSAANTPDESRLKRTITTEITTYLKNPAAYIVKSPMEDLLGISTATKKAGEATAPKAVATAIAPAATSNGSTNPKAQDMDIAAYARKFGAADPQLFELEQRIALELAQKELQERSESSAASLDEKSRREAARTKVLSSAELMEISKAVGEDLTYIKQNPEWVKKLLTMKEEVCGVYKLKHPSFYLQTIQVVDKFEKTILYQISKYLKNPAGYRLETSEEINKLIHETGRSLGFAAPTATGLTATGMSSAAASATATTTFHPAASADMVGLKPTTGAADDVDEKTLYEIARAAGLTVEELRAQQHAITNFERPQLARATTTRMDTESMLRQARRVRESLQNTAAASASAASDYKDHKHERKAEKEDENVDIIDATQADRLGMSIEDYRQAKALELGMSVEVYMQARALLDEPSDVSEDASEDVSQDSPKREEDLAAKLKKMKQMFDYMVNTDKIISFDSGTRELSIIQLGEKVIEEVEKRKFAIALQGWSKPVNASPKVNTMSKDDLKLLVWKMAGIQPQSGSAELNNAMESQAVVSILNAYTTGELNIEKDDVNKIASQLTAQQQRNRKPTTPEANLEKAIRLAVGVKILLFGYLLGPFPLVQAGGLYTDYAKFEEIKEALSQLDSVRTNRMGK